MNVSAIPHARLGIFCMLAGMFLISVNDMLIKSLSGGYPLHQLVMFRALVGLVFTLFLLRMEGGWSLLRTGRPLLHLLRALLIVFANTMIYAAIVAMPLATANALYFVAPLFVTLLSIPILGEKVGPRRFAAIGLGFGGVLLMMTSQLGTGEGALGWLVILPVLAAAGYASMSVLTRKLGQTSRASALALHMQIAFIAISACVFLVAGDGRFAASTENESIRFLLRAWIWPPIGRCPADHTARAGGSRRGLSHGAGVPAEPGLGGGAFRIFPADLCVVLGLDDLWRMARADGLCRGRGGDRVGHLCLCARRARQISPPRVTSCAVRGGRNGPPGNPRRPGCWAIGCVSAHS